jgi:cellulose synthase/poly-beta-1,6-N-acetylglucosamine synthase-like glycosyltransferase
MSVRVSIVVPAYNAQKVICACLESLLNLNFPAAEREILVVDNRSTDRTKEIIRSYPVRYLFESARGVANARNCGLRAAAGEIVAFTDADCIVAPDWLGHLCHPFDDPKTVACAGKVKPLKPRTVVEHYIVYRRILDQEKMLEANRPYSPPFAITANAAFRRSVLQQIGGFDPEIKLAGEDADLCWRLQWSGNKIAYVPNAIVYHKHRTTVRALFRQCFMYGCGNAQLFAKHQKRFGKSFWIDPNPYIWLAKAVLKTPYSLMVGKNTLEMYLPALDAVSNAGLIWGKIHGSLKYRCIVL